MYICMLVLVVLVSIVFIDYMMSRKEKLTEYQKALIYFKKEGYCNFKISLTKDLFHFEILISSTGSISIYQVVSGERFKREFSNNNSGEDFKKCIKNIFIRFVSKKVIIVDNHLLASITGTIKITYEDNLKYYTFTRIISNPNYSNTNNNNSTYTNTNNIDDELAKLCKSFKLPPNSSFTDFKMKYRELCKKYHPDVYGSDDMMKRINIAYERVELYFGKK